MFFDVNNNGQFDPSETPIGGVPISLRETSAAADGASKQTLTGSDGRYEFGDLPAGDYSIFQQQPEFLLDGIDSPGSAGGTVAENDRLSVRLSSDTAATDYNFAERGRLPQYIHLFDCFSSTPHDGLTAAVRRDASIAWFAADWEQARSVELRVDDGNGVQPTQLQPSSALKMTVTDGTGRTMNRAASLYQSGPTQYLGGDVSAALFRMAGRFDDIGFQVVEASVAPDAAPAVASSAGAALPFAVSVNTRPAPVTFPVLRLDDDTPGAEHNPEPQREVDEPKPFATFAPGTHQVADAQPTGGDQGPTSESFAAQADSVFGDDRWLNDFVLAGLGR